MDDLSRAKSSRALPFTMDEDEDSAKNALHVQQHRNLRRSAVDPEGGQALLVKANNPERRLAAAAAAAAALVSASTGAAAAMVVMATVLALARRSLPGQPSILDSDSD